MSDDHPVYEQHPALHEAGYIPTAAVAKLLTEITRQLERHPGDAPWSCIECYYNRPCIERQILVAAKSWVTRPQPAPPAGEPDFHRWLDQKIAEWSAAGGFHDFAVAAKVIRDRLGLAAPPAGEPDFASMAGEVLNPWPNFDCTSLRADIAEKLSTAYRLGLAARPKVEDAEVAAAITYLGDEVPEEKAIADPLERLAGELAEREAELAKADALVCGYVRPCDLGHFDEKIYHEIENRHAARQKQQEANEPTEREAE